MADETILIIDDNADMRLLLSLRLKAHGVPDRLCSRCALGDVRGSEGAAGCDLA
jgi:hypothetical protein